MIMITRTFGRFWIFPLLLVLFAMTLTVANAQTKIGTAQSVKPQAEGSLAGTLAAGSGVTLAIANQGCQMARIP